MTAELWTRVECPCGGLAAIPEAGIYPLCPGCGLRMTAPMDKTRIQLVSEPLGVDEAVKRARAGGAYDGDTIAGAARRYDPEVLRANLERAGFPTEPPDWPSRPSSDGTVCRCPPWEAA